MGKLDDIISKVEDLSVVEMAELVKKMEEKFGVSAAMPAAQAVAGEDDDDAEGKDSFDIVLNDAGGQKIQVIKVLRDALDIGLKEAKDMTEVTPKTIKQGVKKDEAEDMKKNLETAGATVELK